MAVVALGFSTVRWWRRPTPGAGGLVVPGNHLGTRRPPRFRLLRPAGLRRVATVQGAGQAARAFSPALFRRGGGRRSGGRWERAGLVRQQDRGDEASSRKERDDEHGRVAEGG